MHGRRFLLGSKAVMSMLAAACICLFLGSPLWVPSHASAVKGQDTQHWVGTWAAAPQRTLKGVQTFRNQTLRLIVHISAGGKKVRIKLSNIFGEQPLVIGSAHLSRRSEGANIDANSDRALTFAKRSSVTIPTGSVATSDPVDLDVPALSDLAISLFLAEPTPATTLHILAQQTNYVSTETGDSTAATGKSIVLGGRS